MSCKEANSSIDLIIDQILNFEQSELETVTVKNLTAEDEQFLNLLSRFKMDSYFMLLKESGINLKNIKHLTEKDICDIFGKSVGIRAEFRALINEYRESLNLPLLNSYTCCCQYNSQNNKTIGNTRNNVRAQEQFIFDINKFLSSTIGRKTVENYEKKNEFTAEEREFLVASIDKIHLDRNIPMTFTVMEKIADQICSAFKTESKKYYFDKEPYVHGKLYIKYKSLSRSYIKSGMFDARLRVSKSKPFLNKNDEEEGDKGEEKFEETDDLFDDDIEWLRHHSIPWDTVEAKWRNTFAVRRADVEKSSSLMVVFDRWPLLSHSNGGRLVGIDFEMKHPSKSNNLFKNFDNIKENIEAILKKNIKYGPGKQILRKLSSNTEYRILQYFQLLNILIKPTAKKKLDGVVWKVSISDALDSFLVFVNSVADISVAINKRKDFCTQKKTSFQPTIIIVGDETSSKFIVSSDPVIYQFENFLNAFDIFFKLFFVLNLSYPFENVNFLSFIQEYFYKIDSSIDFTDVKSMFKKP